MQRFIVTASIGPRGRRLRHCRLRGHGYSDDHGPLWFPGRERAHVRRYQLIVGRWRGDGINACSLVSAAQASSLVGRQYTAATPSTIAPGQDQCDYARAEGSDLTVIVYEASSGVTFEMMTSVQSGAGTVTNVSGVGDKALVGPIELDVETGDQIIAVEGAGGTLGGDYNGAVAIAKAVIAALK